MTILFGRSTFASVLCMALVALAGCSTTKHPAPVEERGGVRVVKPAPAAPDTAASAGMSAATVVVVESKPGTYVVKPGDTLMRIALDTGQAWRDLVRWNNIENPNLIEVGQVLNVAPPAEGAVATKAVTAPKVDTRPLDTRPVTAAASGASAPAPTASAVPTPAPVTAPSKESDDDVQWAWPASGPVASGFDDNRSKGLAITGKAGDPVYAAADGRVVYAGSGLRGYGNLVIVKHNATYLTAYAHNQTLLVKEDQTVKKGQKIAEMGASDAERVQLHFEIRRQGKPIDPSKLLPSR
ncbi:MAG TPA: peptidoglycan DD-metalloendopeptidase family protein [Ideonella sp.]|nr:peptidoglycan DD-metalloendopeptidase family protein [Ideonella sp.]